MCVFRNLNFNMTKLLKLTGKLYVMNYNFNNFYTIKRKSKLLGLREMPAVPTFNQGLDAYFYTTFYRHFKTIVFSSLRTRVFFLNKLKALVTNELYR